VFNTRHDNRYPTAVWPDADKVPPTSTTTLVQRGTSDTEAGNDGRGVDRERSADHGRLERLADSSTDAAVNITLQVWAKPLSGRGAAPHGVQARGQRQTTGVAVVVLNRGSAVTSLNLTWTTVGLPEGAKVAVRDLWAHADVGTAKGSLWIDTIASHDVKALALTLVA
jgi:hypothetical protein